MIPEELHTSVDVDSSHSSSNEAEEHLNHSENWRFVQDIFSCSFVDKIKHFVSSNMTIGLTDTPLELLQVYFFLDLADHSHVGLGDCQIGCSSESKL